VKAEVSNLNDSTGASAEVATGPGRSSRTDHTDHSASSRPQTQGPESEALPVPMTTAASGPRPSSDRGASVRQGLGDEGGIKTVLELSARGDTLGNSGDALIDRVSILMLTRTP
jgi:hypothetical protein